MGGNKIDLNNNKLKERRWMQYNLLWIYYVLNTFTLILSGPKNTHKELFFFSICRYRNRCQEKVKRLLKDANLVYDEIRIQIQSWLNPKALCVEKNGKFGKQERGVEGI